MEDASEPEPWEDMVLVGRIVRTHGLAGHVVIHPETDFPEERFAPGSRCWVGVASRAEPVVVSASRMQNGRPVVAFAGVSSIDSAARLVGSELRIAESELLPLAEGSYYHHQLVGCRVDTAAGELVGTVVRVEGAGTGASLLVVDSVAGEVLIPMAGGICDDIDVAARRIVVAPPGGLLDLNVADRPSTQVRRRGRRSR